MAVHNFNAGPAALPASVLAKFRDSLIDTDGTGMSVLEWSHRSPEYDRVRFDAEARLRRLLGLPGDDSWVVLFLQGGASLQFAQIPLNLADSARPGHYLVTGVWAKKALEEAERLQRGRSLWSGKAENFCALPPDGMRFAPEGAAYVHLCTNNTIYGTQWAELPDTGAVPLVCDMSSDILSRPRPFEKCSLIYAGAQKNLGPSGLTVVALRRSLLDRQAAGIPAILDYRAHVEADGLYNTPPTGAVYLMGLVLAWIEEEGGLTKVGARNRQKAARLYDTIDRSGFFRGTAARESRSDMNVTFRLPTEALEKSFLERAEREGMVGLKGHRSVGGIRASLYNAVELASVEALVSVMHEFASAHGAKF